MSDAPAPGSGAFFDRIAPRYDLLNRLMSFGIDRLWRKRTVAALELPDHARVLDLATGTGDLALDLAASGPGIRVVGLDPSARMMAAARPKLGRLKAPGRVVLVQGDGLNLPFGDRAFDAVTIAFGIRNYPDRLRGLAEMARVCRPGGRVAILELGEPHGVMGPLARTWVHGVVPRMGALLSGAREYDYLQDSIAAFPPPADFAALMREAGLDVVAVRPFTFGACTLFVGTPAA